MKPSALSHEEYQKLLHDPTIMGVCTNLANQIVAATGSPQDFEVYVQNNPSYRRGRAFAKPATYRGYMLELRDALLVKAVGGSGNQRIDSPPPTRLVDAAGASHEFKITHSGVQNQ